MRLERRFRPSVLAALVYVLLGCLWIAFSDDAVRKLAADPDTLTLLQNLKGWVYVLLTAILIYGLVEALDWRNRRLRALDRQFRVSFQESPTGIALLDPQGRVEIANPALATLLSRPEPALRGRTVPALLGRRVDLPADGLCVEIPMPAARGRDPRTFEIRRVALEAPLAGQAGVADEARGSMLLVEDVSVARRAATEQRLAAVAFETRGPILVTDAQGVILRVNRAFCELTGYRAEELIGRNPRILESDRQNAAFHRRMWDRLLETGHWEGELWNLDRAGKPYPQWQSISAVRDDRGAIAYFVAHITDLTERREIEARIDELEHLDLLTGLPNRRSLLERLALAFPGTPAAASTAEPSIGAPVSSSGALMLIDVDDFHVVNEGLGMETGDQVLRAIARVLVQLAGTEGQQLARISSDIFAVAFMPPGGGSGESLLQAVGAYAERLRARIRQLDEVPAASGALTVSIGVHLFDADDRGPADALNHAEQALSRAKQGGPGGFALFARGMQAEAEARLRLAADLRLGLAAGEIHAHFQCKCSADGRIVGAEALARWRRADGATVSPAVFVPMAEALGLEAELGERMRRQALELAARLAQAGCAIPVAVNLAARELRQPDLPDRIVALLAEYRLPPQSLILEVTESQLIDDFDAISAVLARLRAAGMRVAIDDFGTGFSSLSYLKRLPVDELKIDGSFVADAAHAPRDQALLRAIVSLGHTLGLAVVAEGVETDEQLALLSSLGCEVFQGWRFGRPVDADGFMAQAVGRC
ncbi:putative bifunctional diguanylate cyclase/phosphodiesterase [Zeimonas arvi]|uniref:putative bifunctional diguanylate cyclase/phosphodiesterase n=1 Tax=Zeimonas arvi TaxID=2498847 RepID=UPI00164F6641|nr:EAL domain-containing protein [Zeimonas arvi]